VLTVDSIKRHSPGFPPPEVVYEPLNLACQPHKVTPQTMSTAIDCLGKLISYQFFIDPPLPTSAPDSIVPAIRADAPTQPLMHRVVDTITKAFEGDVTDVRVQLQIIKALLTTVLNEGDERTMVHGPALLKCIRGVYNISLLGRADGGIQAMAQGMLMQMVGTIFGRVNTKPRGSSTTVNLDKELAATEDAEPRTPSSQQITLYVLCSSSLIIGIRSKNELVLRSYEEPKQMLPTSTTNTTSK
jgi:brefeldin A-inhibited guanine nucleotide-exchange protein